MNTTIFSVLAIPNLLIKLLTFNLLNGRTKQINKESRLSRSPCYLSVCVSVSKCELHGRFLRNMVWALRHKRHPNRLYLNFIQTVITRQKSGEIVGKGRQYRRFRSVLKWYGILQDFQKMCDII
jgi:hypothetical protein